MCGACSSSSSEPKTARMFHLRLPANPRRQECSSEPKTARIFISAGVPPPSRRVRRPRDRRKYLFALLPLLAHAISFRGWVNPLAYERWTPETNERVMSVFQNMDDGEKPDEVTAAINKHVNTESKWREVLRKNRNRGLVGTSDCNTTLSSTEYVEHAQLLVDHGVALTRTFLNIGAYDAMTEDPVYRFAKDFNATGIYLEKDRDMCDRAAENLQSLGRLQRIICSGATPGNLVSLLEEHAPGVRGGKRHFDLIKIDIDSFDALLLDALLRDGFSAKHIVLEVNPAIPPPYKFATLYHPRLFDVMTGAADEEQDERGASSSSTGGAGDEDEGAGPAVDSADEMAASDIQGGKETSLVYSNKMHNWPLRGMSLSYAVDKMRSAGYDFVSFGYHDAYFVHRNFREIYGFATPFDEFDCYHRAFIASNGVPIGKTRRWFYEASLEQGASEIFEHMVRHSLRWSGGKHAFPFHLSY